MKLMQINKSRKCPCCNKYTLITPQDTGMGSDWLIRTLWHYICTNCNAQFQETK